MVAQLNLQIKSREILPTGNSFSRSAEGKQTGDTALTEHLVTVKNPINMAPTLAYWAIRGVSKAVVSNKSIISESIV